MISFPRERVRLAVNAAGRSSVGSIIDAITGSSPDFWRATDVQIEVTFFWGDPDSLQKLLDISLYSTITIEFRDPQRMTGPALITKTVASADFNLATTYETWIGGTAQQATFTLTDTETSIPMAGQSSKTLTLVISGITTAGDRVVFGATNVLISESGLSSSAIPQPVFGANLIPPGAVYDGFGVYTPSGILINTRYEWSKGANDTNVVNGTETYSANAGFVTQAASLTLNGTPGALVTAALRYPIYPTWDQVNALIAGMLKHVLPAGKTITFVSDGSIKGRVLGVTDAGQRIDKIIDIA
jgi:hypothetical protein